MNQSYLADALGLSQSAISKAISRGMPSDDVEAARAWRAANVRPRADSVNDAVPGAPDYHAARARREAAEATIAELRQAELEGLLIRVDAVRSVAASTLAATREALLQIPSRMASVLASESSAARVHELLQDEIHQALSQLASLPSRIGQEACDDDC